jgi:malate dehydrogenase
LQKRNKITVIGAGNVGATVAQKILEMRLGDVALVDVMEGVPQGKGLDLLESAPIVGISGDIVGTNTYDETAGSDLIIITAGMARKPGMSRDDLLAANVKIVSEVTKAAAPLSPDAKIIVVTNPMDVMAYVAWKVSGFSKERVIGMGGVLDAARFRTFISIELGISADSIQAFVLGGHGDQMLPLPRYTTVAGIPITELMDQESIDSVVERTRNGGAEIVSLLKTGSAFYAPASAAAAMAQAILFDQKRILPCSVLLEGEYKVSGAFTGVPVILGTAGVEEILQVALTDEERAAFDKSVEAVRKGQETTGF